jgi:carbamoyl-phosphate synthase large subunit
MKDEGLGMKDEGLGMKDEGLGMKDEGLGMKDEGLGMKDEGLGMNATTPQSLIPNPQSPILNPQSLIPILRRAKRMGISDVRIAELINKQPSNQATNQPINQTHIRQLRLSHDIRAKFYRVDTCAAEFEAHTPYLYSHYERLDEAEPTNKRKIVILGGGPNRIGQGIEFDYCCVQACLALREMDIETIMINCNPETVSTDYDTADRLYFEPLTLEDVLNVIDTEKPTGVIVQFGGQTPINLTRGLAAAGVPILGTTPDAIDLAEDRIRFGNLLAELDIPSPAWGAATLLEEAKAIAQRIGYPVLVRPSYVIGGRAMEIAHDDEMLAKFLIEATRVSEANAAGKITVLIDHYLEDSFEADVDAIGDGDNVVVVGVMEHIEEAGVHSGDSACVLPPIKISAYHDQIMRDYTERLGVALRVKGLMNVQYAIKDEIVYVLEVNPRASRTVPYVSKATGYPIAKYAAQIMGGKTLNDLGFTESPDVEGFHIKEVVLPFKKFPGADYKLGPEMKSTGEVMGSADSFGHAFAKAQLMAGAPLPTSGNALITVNDFDKGAVIKIARDLHRLGFKLIATSGTASVLSQVGLPVIIANKVYEGGDHTVELVRHGQVQLIINTPMGAHAQDDSRAMRMAAVLHSVPLLTTLSAATAAVQGIAALKKGKLMVQSLQDRFRAKGK